MDRNDTDAHEIYAPGIACQLNYSRTFVGLDKVIVHIPGGFHLESFDQKEKRVGLASLIFLCSSAITYANCPDKNDRSFLNVHKMAKNGLLFIAFTRCEIDQSFYKITSRKWPLDVIISLYHAGNTSFTVSYVLQSREQIKPYAKVLVTTVLISKDTMKPCHYPVWWKNAFSSLADSKLPPRMETILRPPSYSSLPLNIYYSDTDDNKHTSWTTYIRTCYDAFMDGVTRQTYSTITEEEASKGVKTFEIRFLKESLVGDKLKVYSWEKARTSNKTLCFETRKGHDICYQATMTFHKNFVDNDGMSSKL